MTLDDGTMKIFLNTKGKIDDVSPETKNFLEYVERGIISGKFVTELNDAVQSVKFNKEARLEFMTFEMYMKEREMEIAKRSREEGREEGLKEGLEEGLKEGLESVALKMIGKGKTLEEIREFTELSLERIKELFGMKDE